MTPPKNKELEELAHHWSECLPALFLAACKKMTKRGYKVVITSEKDLHITKSKGKEGKQYKD